ncbi:MAG: ABC transporter ATP-binding protein [Bacteroidales bacterium]|nr:ABC transporter ATP-binding protein [Bacteroidales bacterium]
MKDYSIQVKNISKRFRIYKSPKDRLKEALSLAKRQYHKDFWALQNISFSLEKGTTMGILGVNGSGKSTLLKIVCGYLVPTSGSVKTNGRISSILELGTGFNRDFSGRENVLLYGGLMGLSKKEIKEKLPLVEAFADIGDFFERPMRLYSSGMYARLAFACTIHVDPDILIIDEALAVGDIAFQHKCMDRINKLQKQGVTVLLVSHSIAAIKSLCQEGILLEKGRVIKEGSAEDVANYYHGLIAEREQGKTRPLTQKQKPAKPVESTPVKDASRVGTGEVRINEVLLLDSEGNHLKAVDFDQDVCISVHLEARVNCRPAVVGCIIRDRFGIDLLGTNTAVEDLDLPEMDEGEKCSVDFRMRLPLLTGTYSITAAVGHDPGQPIFYDWWDVAYTFEMVPPLNRKIVNCKLHLPIKIDIYKFQ